MSVNPINNRAGRITERTQERKNDNIQANRAIRISRVSVGVLMALGLVLTVAGSAVGMSHHLSPLVGHIGLGAAMGGVGVFGAGAIVAIYSDALKPLRDVDELRERGSD